MCLAVIGFSNTSQNVLLIPLQTSFEAECCDGLAQRKNSKVPKHYKGQCYSVTQYNICKMNYLSNNCSVEDFVGH